MNDFSYKMSKEVFLLCMKKYSIAVIDEGCGKHIEEYGKEFMFHTSSKILYVLCKKDNSGYIFSTMRKGYNNCITDHFLTRNFRSPIHEVVKINIEDISDIETTSMCVTYDYKLSKNKKEKLMEYIRSFECSAIYFNNIE